ncbi:hypothetical protein MKZ38_004463 [Zalerion maritima]|uniref:Piwi domain-containing protein n=1 Tax=Zalerion maritima TaxID=339359 RepID=A0AAD5RYH6_9PEZI|nr:hypothetical protein MKZ38_004463 [Zalerion maritima]
MEKNMSNYVIPVRIDPANRWFVTRLRLTDKGVDFDPLEKVSTFSFITRCAKEAGAMRNQYGKFVERIVAPQDVFEFKTFTYSGVKEALEKIFCFTPEECIKSIGERDYDIQTVWVSREWWATDFKLGLSNAIGMSTVLKINLKMGGYNHPFIMRHCEDSREHHGHESKHWQGLFTTARCLQAAGPRQATTGYPKNIVWYQGGVSESQYDQVIEVGIPTPKKAYSETVNNKNTTTKFTTYIVGKRHHTIFFRDNERKNNLEMNPALEAVVNSTVTESLSF